MKRFMAHGTLADWIVRGTVIAAGQMLADLARKQNFVGMHRDSIEQVLGPSDCYEVQDGWPCYQVQLGDRLYQFTIALNDPAKPGHVSSIYLQESP